MDRLSRKFTPQVADAPPVQQAQQFQQPQQVRRVLVGTPCYDGRIEVWYANSLMQIIKASRDLGVEIIPIWLSYDALVQRARNDLMGIMIETGCDDIVFIDSDIDFDVGDFYKLLSYPVDVVGGTYRKKGDAEMYVAKILDLSKSKDPSTGLLAVDGLGTGFLRLSKRAVQYLWDNSIPYEEKDQGKVRRWIFDVQIQNGEIISEDILMCQKLKNAGFTIWLDTGITCGHIGPKRFTGNFDAWFNNIRGENQTRQPNYGTITPLKIQEDIKSLYE
jgi:hypothetical protein